ncbi:MAG: hypothetical protein RRY16_00485 [Bacilli bacterium]
MKKNIIIISCVLIIAIGIFYFCNSNKEVKTDSQKFALEYKNVPDKNLFVYRNIDNIISILKGGTGIIYLGFPECPWCQAYVPILNEVAIESKLDKIFYFNIKEERAKNTDDYQLLVSLLAGQLYFNDEGKERIYVPDVIIVKNGKIIGHDNETSIVTEKDGTPKEYWTNDRIEKLKAKLHLYTDQIKNTSCSSACDK